MKSWTDPTSSFHFSETMQVFSNPITPSSIKTQNPKEQKPTTIGLTIYKYWLRTKLRHLARGRSEGKLSNPWGSKRKYLTHLPSSFPWSTPEPERLDGEMLPSRTRILAEEINKFDFSWP